MRQLGKDLPIKNTEDLENLHSKHSVETMVAYFSEVGGKDAKEMVRKAMDELMTDELKMRYTLEGKSTTKRRFKKLPCCDAVVDAVITRFPLTPKHNIVDFISRRLVHSKQNVSRKTSTATPSQ